MATQTYGLCNQPYLQAINRVYRSIGSVSDRTEAMARELDEVPTFLDKLLDNALFLLSNGMSTAATCARASVVQRATGTP